jgi:hypothetical protein
MLNRIRDQIGAAGLIVAIVALIAAIGGSAVAATGLNQLVGGSAKRTYAKKRSSGVTIQQVRRIARQEAAKTAVPGPAGATGPAGPKGDTGSQGLQGPPGKDGQTGFTEMLPAGRTLVGSWSAENEWETAENNVQGFYRSPISFGIPLNAAPNVRLLVGPFFFTVNSSGTFVPDTSPEAEENFEAVCPGSADEPEAEPGNLCIYTDNAVSASYATLKLSNPTTTPAPHIYGWSLPLTLEAEGSIEGSWAVTAEG